MTHPNAVPTTLTPADFDPPVVSRGGRSFDFAGHRVRLEGSAHTPGDRVPEIVTVITRALVDVELGTTATAIVDAVLARHAHRANYPLADDHPDIASYEAATSAWRIDDHNLDRAITRAAEHHLAQNGGN